MLVMHKSVSLKYTLEGRSMRTEEVPSVHQPPVYLVLDKGHQNARENEPATNLQNKHQRSLVTASTEPPVPSASSSTRPNASTAVILATDCAPPFPRLVTPTVAFRDTPAGSPLTRHRLHSVGLVITSGATRAARCTGESAERGSPSSSFPRVAG